MSDALLSDEDVQYLNAIFPGRWNLRSGPTWAYGLTITGYQIPAEYRPSSSDLLLLIPPSYPVAAIDMFYFSPGLARRDGQEIEALQPETYFSRQWQRWSRHYAWEPGLHSLVSHLEYVRNQLRLDAN